MILSLPLPIKESFCTRPPSMRVFCPSLCLHAGGEIHFCPHVLPLHQSHRFPPQMPPRHKESFAAHLSIRVFRLPAFLRRVATSPKRRANTQRAIAICALVSLFALCDKAQRSLPAVPIRLPASSREIKARRSVGILGRLLFHPCPRDQREEKEERPESR